MDTEILLENVGKIFECKLCNYITNKKFNISKHLLTVKHKKIAVIIYAFT